MTNLPIYTSAKQAYEAFDGDFLFFLEAGDQDAFSELKKARQQEAPLSPEYLTKTAIIFEAFLCDKFDLHTSLEALNAKYNLSKDIIFVKRYVVMRVASKKYPSLDLIDLSAVLKLKKYFTEQSFYASDEHFDKSFAELIIASAKNETKNEELYDKLLQYSAFAVLSEDGKALHKDSSLFNIPQKIDWMRLFDFNLDAQSNLLTSKKHIDRNGFNFFDKKPNSTEVSWQANYCIYCHNQKKDYCRTGFDESKQGCPLDQKISEMNFTKSKGYHLAALVIAMLDNPLVLLTGRRICNDCSKACIYQKTTPVDIPSLESQIVEDCLTLPYGFEVYNLLTLYNPLETENYKLITNTAKLASKKVLVAGLGPAGIASAHYLTKHGVSVLAIDGLALNPLKPEYFEPIKDCKNILQQNLENRTSTAFGGVMEYGITARWNKNLLQLAKIILFRRANFKAHGGIRLDGNFNLNFFTAKGFDYAILALGSGEPKLAKINGIDGVKQGFVTSSNFLMSLHSSYAFAGHSIDNENIINLKSPVFILGGGLTATDCASEALALLKAKGVQNPEVSILYHKRLQDSPAYRLNHEELEDCMAQGVRFYQNTAVTSVNHKDGVLDSLNLNNGTQVKAGSIITAFGTEQKLINLDKDCGIAYKTLGDMNPEYQGSVVKAIASAKNSYLEIIDYLTSLNTDVKKELDLSSTLLSISKADGGFVKLVIKSNLIEYYKAKPADICKIQILNSKNLNCQFKPMPITIADVDYANNTLDLYIKQCGRASNALINNINVGDEISFTPSPCPIDYTKYKTVIIYNNSPNASYGAGALKSYLTKQGILVFNFNDITQPLSKPDGKTLLFAILLEDVSVDELKTSCKADDVYILRHKNMQCMLKGVCSKCLFFDEASQNFKYTCKM
jgi:NADPH-dependent glutamate synthase beta subunit-like oxidoreductase